MIDQVVIGASITMTPMEAHKLAGDGKVRLVTCPDGRVIGGVGSVGLLEHVDNTDLEAFVDEVKAKRAALTDMALLPQPANPRENLYKFTRI